MPQRNLLIIDSGDILFFQMLMSLETDLCHQFLVP
jgi:hypothetical protein